MRWVLGSLDPEKGNKKRVWDSSWPNLVWPQENMQVWQATRFEAAILAAISSAPHATCVWPLHCAGKGSEGDGEEAAGHEAAQHQQLRGCAHAPTVMGTALKHMATDAA